jgi:hypothetical protein
MGIFSYFSEKKLIAKVQKLIAIQKETCSRFDYCKTQKNWVGAASDIRMMLENISYTEHIFALYSQNNGFNINHNSELGRYAQATYEAGAYVLSEISKIIIQEPDLRKIFTKQMASETSQWKPRMIWALTRDNEDLKSLENEINNA